MAKFAKRTVKDLKLPPIFFTHIVQSIQSQLADFRALEGQDMHIGEKIVPIKDLNNFESDPEEFARTFCRDLVIEDPEVGPAIAFAIWEKLYKSVTSTRESKLNKNGRRRFDLTPIRAALDLMKLFGNRWSVVRKRREWDVYESIVDILSNEEVEAFEAREEKNAAT